MSSAMESTLLCGAYWRRRLSAWCKDIQSRTNTLNLSVARACWRRRPEKSPLDHHAMISHGEEGPTMAKTTVTVISARQAIMPTERKVKTDKPWMENQKFPYSPTPRGEGYTQLVCENVGTFQK
ncbi:hypothetical protein E2C01_074964 [Portunus trituberculatus]|uniref:Uncharacterized protein n=1 Tax=Portunus trituberculatus TaxID=210409 RepID=A0A5B7IEJ2_PORTR|nr:hypothetical protein [Portunus trituberculatus]